MRAEAAAKDQAAAEASAAEPCVTAIYAQKEKQLCTFYNIRKLFSICSVSMQLLACNRHQLFVAEIIVRNCNATERNTK